MKTLTRNIIVGCALMLTACAPKQEVIAQDGVKGTILRDQTIQSTVLNREMKYSVYLPENYSESKTYPVLYLLHGYGGDQNDWWVYDDIAYHADTMMATGEIPELIIVTPDGRTWMYIDNCYGNGLNYETYFFTELMPQVESRFHIRQDRQSRAIGGFSMGGYGALRYGVMHHERFCYTYAMSSVIGGYGATDMSDIIRNYQPSELPGITLECGDDDYFTYDNREFSALLTSLGVTHEHIERVGDHDWVFWSACSPKILRKVGALFSGATAVEQITSDQSPSTNKVLRDGRLLIERNGETYNLEGKRL